jgi:hypothetical protein
MNLISYLINHFFYRLVEFFRHWYLDSFKIYSHFVISLLEKFDRRLAFRITLKYLFQPLYQDRSVIGYILGFFFRTSRLMIGGIIYFFIIVAALIVYLIWLMILPYIIYQIGYSLLA